jgi:hypothetical protein
VAKRQHMETKTYFLFSIIRYTNLSYITYLTFTRNNLNVNVKLNTGNIYDEKTYIILSCCIRKGLIFERLFKHSHSQMKQCRYVRYTEMWDEQF